MMYHLDGRRRRQSLVYFGEPQDLAIWRIDTLGIRIYMCVCKESRRSIAPASMAYEPHAIAARRAKDPASMGV